MEGAGIGRFIAALLAAKHRAAVAAGIDEGVQLALAVAGDEDGLAAHRGGEVAVVVRNLALMGEIDPIALEDVAHLELEQFRIGEDIPREPEDALAAVATQRSMHRHRTISGQGAPATDSGGAHLEARRGLPVAQPFLQHCGQRALPQIQRKRFRHQCRPPPGRQLESESRRFGYPPRFSQQGGRSNPDSCRSAVSSRQSGLARCAYRRGIPGAWSPMLRRHCAEKSHAPPHRQPPDWRRH